MTEPTIQCPSCRAEIRLTQSLAAPLIESTRRQYEQRIAQKETEISKREAAIQSEREALVKAQDGLDLQIDAKLKAERPRIAAEEAKKARLIVATDLDQKFKELADLREVLSQRDAKLAEAQQAQAELIRKQRELDDAKREMDLIVERRVQQSLVAARAQARKDAEEEFGLKILEKEQTIEGMRRQVEELKRKAEQGSQQLQGEVLELELESILRGKFPRDTIDPVAKGERGGDIIHCVLGTHGQRCGTILWETKRTKSWSDGWLAKIRDDQRAAKADIAVIVSQILPKDVSTFELIEGVWVASPRVAIPIAVALRHSLLEIAAARQAREGQQSKMELIYEYLSGPRFRQRVQAIVEKFIDMQADLDKERKTMTRLWAKRDEQIRGVIEATAGLYGDLQGIAGRTLQEIEGLELPLGIDRNGDAPSTKQLSAHAAETTQ